jgi:hypothetical protein
VTGIRDMLHREIYRGVEFYGRKRSVDRDGRAGVMVDAPADKLLRRENPEWRIVSDDLWRAVQKRLADTRAQFRRGNGELHGRAPSGLEGRYFLSGFLRCARCQAPMIVASRGGHESGQTKRVYVCSAHRNRGASACTMAGALRLTEIHERIVRDFTDSIFTPTLLETVVANLVAQAKAPAASTSRDSARAELRRVEARLTHLVNAIAEGSAPAAVIAAIKSHEQERDALEVRLAEFDGQDAIASAERPSLEAKVRAEITDWTKALKLTPAAGRHVLRRVLTTPIFVQQEPDGGWTYRLTGSFAGMLRTVAGVQVPAAELDALTAALEAGEDPFTGGGSPLRLRWGAKPPSECYRPRRPQCWTRLSTTSPIWAMVRHSRTRSHAGA